MTHLTTGHHHQAKAAETDSSSALGGETLAALLDQDDIVRPELRNAAILGAQRASRGSLPAARRSHTLAGRS
ncbi:hypothetical protein [Halomonas sp. 11-S5]|uniref:hypothetical protein n=1 Tax=Halomonas sp. 11-S5 TaxID=2994064 RepID=UPI002468D962|nr:hypothetical protein [Halomonas sp. 11-S5]